MAGGMILMGMLLPITPLAPAMVLLHANGIQRLAGWALTFS